MKSRVDRFDTTNQHQDSLHSSLAVYVCPGEHDEGGQRHNKEYPGNDEQDLGVAHRQQLTIADGFGYDGKLRQHGYGGAEQEREQRDQYMWEWW